MTESATRTPILHDLSHIWEPPTVERAKRELEEAERAYAAHPGATTQAAVCDAVFRLIEAEEELG